MIPKYLQKNLELFRDDEYKIVSDKNTEVCIEEEQDEGKATLKSCFEKDAIVFHYPEKNTLPYLDSEKGCCKCADKFLFIKNDENKKWKLHILEFKKSIKYDKWKKARNQFKYGIMNARALAAFLNLEIDEIVLETAYRNEWNPFEKSSSSTEMRKRNSAGEVKAYKEWQSDSVELELDSENRSFHHHKIKLDDMGNGMKVFI